MKGLNIKKHTERELERFMTSIKKNETKKEARSNKSLLMTCSDHSSKKKCTAYSCIPQLVKS